MPNLSEIQQLIVDGQYQQALSALDNLDEDNPDTLYMRGVCQRYLGQNAAALTSLSRLKGLSPGNARAYQEEGHVHRSEQNWPKALNAYQRASQYNPALAASLRGQLEALVNLGRQQQAMQVNEQLKQLEQLPKPLIAVMDLIAQGKLVRAEEICRQFLQKVPHHIEAMRLLAGVGVKLGMLDDAEFLLESAHKFAPAHRQVAIDYIQVLRKKQKFEAARGEAKTLLDSAPNNPQYQSIYAVESMQCGHFDEAITLFDGVLKTIPEDPVTLTSKGHALKTIGEFDQAVASYQAAAKSRPNHGEAYYSLANLKRYQFSDLELKQMLDLNEGEDLDPRDQVFLQFALGKAFEDREDYDRAFQHYASGNQIKRHESRYDRDKMSLELNAQKIICTSSLFAKHQNTGHGAPDPIFILGLPRAGSTLLEQILSSHSLVDGTLELPNILSMAHQLRRGDKMGASAEYPSCLQAMTAEELSHLGQKYIDETRVHRGGAPSFIDKMPNNFRHIGLIKLILPNAKIIDARRDPMSCCFSGFKQLFAEGQDFTYSLEDIGQYYQDYVALMDHWDEVLPGAVLRVQHEDVVADLEGQVRRILQYCGLEFEMQCVEYYKTERHVRTPSSEQVRQPIFTDSLEQWRNFEKHLGPLRSALGQLEQ